MPISTEVFSPKPDDYGTEIPVEVSPAETARSELKTEPPTGEKPAEAASAESRTNGEEPPRKVRLLYSKELTQLTNFSVPDETKTFEAESAEDDFNIDEYEKNLQVSLSHSFKSP